MPQAHLNWAALTTLIGEINSQGFASTQLNLQLPADQTLSADQASTAATWSLMINQPAPTSIAETYALTLRETDHVLPGAFLQWEQVSQRHPASLISLASFAESASLDDQMTAYLANYSAEGTPLNTQPETADERWIALWGLQSYSVQSNLQSQAQLAQRLRPTGILIPATLYDNQWPLASLNQILAGLQQGNDVIRLHVPTILTRDWPEVTPLAWLDELETVDVSHLDVQWAPIYTDFMDHQLNTLLGVAGRRHVSATDHRQLLTRIKDLNTQPAHWWTRLGLLQLLSPQMAHQLFY
ncbi:hypothetical protein FD13_GL000347 [Levilactobacillus senmaizukei DSM 21775 = NBRC 103853]|uniref:Uncharacterized protein n=1 Tax=Levilactobacillus senmaizukei DSM 21775 = NBRC 103853 TaxID=1423803 RepID=A0A0R2DPB1_9LACO|nr:hypothetical protein FD13_GL000347 [Levilactobacillus senmaizukei DSM 21775 = NBRC 103853]